MAPPRPPPPISQPAGLLPAPQQNTRKKGEAARAVFEANDLDIVKIILKDLKIFDQYRLLLACSPTSGFSHILARQSISKLYMNPNLLVALDRYFPGTHARLEDAVDGVTGTRPRQKARRAALKDASHDFDEFTARRFLHDIFRGRVSAWFDSICAGCLGTPRGNALQEGCRQWCSQCAAYRLSSAKAYLPLEALQQAQLAIFLDFNPCLTVKTPSNSRKPLPAYVHTAAVKKLISQSGLSIKIPQLRKDPSAPLTTPDLKKLVDFVSDHIEQALSEHFNKRSSDFLQPLLDFYGRRCTDMLDVYGLSQLTFPDFSNCMRRYLEQHEQFQQLLEIAKGNQPDYDIRYCFNTLRDEIKDGSFLNGFPMAVIADATNGSPDLNIWAHIDFTAMSFTLGPDAPVFDGTKDIWPFVGIDLYAQYLSARQDIFSQALDPGPSQQLWAVWMNYVRASHGGRLLEGFEVPRPSVFNPAFKARAQAAISSGANLAKLWLHCSVAQSFSDELMDWSFLGSEEVVLRKYDVVFKVALEAPVLPWLSERMQTFHGAYAGIEFIDRSSAFPLSYTMHSSGLFALRSKR